jgi:hypothetical protein
LPELASLGFVVVDGLEFWTLPQRRNLHEFAPTSKSHALRLFARLFITDSSADREKQTQRAQEGRSIG